MNFHKIDVNMIPAGKGRGYTQTRLHAQLEEFVNMNVPAVRVTSWEQNYKTVKSAQESIRRCAKHFKLPVLAVTRKEKDLYLIRTDM